MSDPKAGLYSVLSSDSTLGAMLAGTAAIYEAVAPQDARLPCVVFNQQAETDIYALQHRAWEEYVYQVKAVTDGASSLTAGSIAGRIDALLTDGSIAVSGGTAFYMRREAQIDYAEVHDGRVFRHRGGLYRIHLQ